jgi:hypothetical protein
MQIPNGYHMNLICSNFLDTSNIHGNKLIL